MVEEAAPEDREMSNEDKRQKLLNRFNKYVPQMLNHSACWNWQGAVNKYGRGRININGKARLASRVAWELHTGEELSSDRHIMRICDSNACVNPSHLFCVEAEDRYSSRKVACPRGEDHMNACLDNAQVIQIRKLYDNNIASTGEIADMYAINPRTVYGIVKRKTWKHI
jgi:hypothetical protein